MLYQLYDQILESSIPLPELLSVETGPAQLAFALLETEISDTRLIEWFHQWPALEVEGSENPWLRFGKLSGEYVLRYPDLADFLISADGLQIRCYPAANIPHETIRHLLLDGVLPLAMSRSNKIILHAGAVALPERREAVIFLGESGSGKSTLTLSFAQHGFPLLTDDCLLLEEQGGRLFGYPSYPGLRIWPDVAEGLFPPETQLAPYAHYSDKKRVVLEHVALPYNRVPLPICGVFFLASPEDAEGSNGIEVTPINPKEAFIELYKQLFNLDINDLEWLKQSFVTLGQVKRWPHFARISYPRQLNLLPRLQEAILTILNDKS